MKNHRSISKNAREVSPWLTAMTSQLLSMSFDKWFRASENTFAVTISIIIATHQLIS